MSAIETSPLTAGQSSVAGQHPDDRYAPTPDGRRICYRVEGWNEGPVVVLVAGLLQDLLSWPDGFLDALVDQGLRVVRLDNRDAGRSTPGDRPPPSIWQQVRGRARDDAYALEDMADDVVAVLDHLQVPAAHVVGMSMGGMVAQCLAAHHPGRALSLTSLWSTTGARDVGGMDPSTRRLMLQRPPRDRGESVLRHVQFIRHMAGSRFGVDAAAERILGCETWDRAVAHGPEAALRQIQAITASGDRTEDLRRITVPTLVVHGDRDLVVDPSGGRATANAVPGARLLVVPGLGHHLSPSVAEPLGRVIGTHVRGEEPDVPTLLSPISGLAQPVHTDREAPGRRTWGSRAVVTGAGSGIGREIALELAARGGRVVCADIDASAAEATAEEVRGWGGRAIAVQVDVTSEHSVRALADVCVGWFGAPTLVVNNAGVGTAGRRVGETPVHTWRRATEVNLWGVVLGCEIFVPLLRRTGGPRGVINVVSAAGYTASPGMGAYNVGKAGALALSETLAAEFARGEPGDDELAVSVVCPTFVETGIVDGELMDETSAAYVRERAAALGTTAADVARTALDEHDRGTLYVFPSRDARRYWRLKRLLPTVYPRLAARATPGATMQQLDSDRPASTSSSTRTMRTPRSPLAVRLPGPVQPRQSLGALLAGPVVLGVLAGLALGWAGPAYWMVQVLAVVLTPVGVVKMGARAAVGPALLGGLVFGVTILAVRALTGWPDATDLGMDPVFLPVVTATVGGLLGAWGGARNARA